MMAKKTNPTGNSTNKMPVVVLVSTVEAFSMGVPERLCQDSWDEHQGSITLGHAAGRSSPIQDGIGQVETRAVEQSCPRASFRLTHSSRNV